MSSTMTPPDPVLAPAPERHHWRRLMWVHLGMIAAALVGIGWTSVASPPSTPSIGGGGFWVWLALVPIYCAACIWHGWTGATETRMRTRLVLTQVLHWLAFLFAMYLVTRADLRGVLNDNAVGLTLLMLLAMGTFVAGVHAWSWAICATGLLLALAIPVLAWLDENVVLVLVAVLLVAVIAVAVLVLRRRYGGGAPAT
jgi:hypothetical protein